MMMRKLLASVALLTTAGLAAGSIVDGMNASFVFTLSQLKSYRAGIAR
jgi:hypothetical protein